MLKGRYAGIKSVLANSLDRFSNVVVQQISIKRGAGDEELEASVSLLMLGRPLLAPPGPKR